MQPTASEIVTEIVMSRGEQPWLVVEGESDERFFRIRKFPTPVKIVIAYGWENVRDVLAQYSKEKSSAKVIGLIDRDYRDHLRCQIFLERLILTDLRDVENVLFKSSALERVISEYSALNKLPRDQQGSINIEAIRNGIYACATQLGKLRIYCQQQGINISFKKIEHKKFVDDKTLSIQVEKMIAHLAGKNPGKTWLTDEDWRKSQQLSWPDSQLSSPDFVANGHDVMSLLGIALRRLWGSCGGEISGEWLESVFRIGYGDHELNSTRMWNDLKNCLTCSFLGQRCRERDADSAITSAASPSCRLHLA